jgi:hypothetical protein
MFHIIDTCLEGFLRADHVFRTFSIPWLNELSRPRRSVALCQFVCRSERVAYEATSNDPVLRLVPAQIYPTTDCLATDVRHPPKWARIAVGHVLQVEGDGYSHRNAELIIRHLVKVMAALGHLCPGVCASRTPISID